MINLDGACKIVKEKYRDLYIKSKIIETDIEFIISLDYGDGTDYEGSPLAVSKRDGTILECEVHMVSGDGVLEDDQSSYNGSLEMLDDNDLDNLGFDDEDDYDSRDFKSKLNDRLDRINDEYDNDSYNDFEGENFF